MAAYRNTLEIGHSAKGIPYGGTGELRADGGANYGFKNLKSDIARIADVPELKDDPALKRLIFAINQPTTGIFSVGCLSGDVADPQGHRCTGYVEFAFNSKSMILDAANYFPAFFHFERVLHDSQFSDPVGFAWELDEATFTDGNSSGFTLCVYVNTGFFGSRDEARACWGSRPVAWCSWLAVAEPLATRALNMAP